MRFIKSIKKIVFSRISVCVLGIIIQITFLGALFWSLGTMFSYSYLLFTIFALALSIYIINTGTSTDYKLIWIFTVLSFPVFGIMLYLFFGIHRNHTFCETTNIINQTSDFICDDLYLRQALYIANHCNTDIYSYNDIEYFKNGELLFPAMLEELKKAESFIFLEFFILEHGVMWDSILSILKAKVREGVDVRVIYDDMGCLLTLPRNYRTKLESFGIRCCVYGRLKPFWTSNMNNRDHRKMMIIDGNTAFTGGINLADEYINAYEKHGYWKDSALMINGSAASKFTEQFLRLWNILSLNKRPDTTICKAYKFSRPTDVIVPFFDSPNDNEPLGRNIYINMLNSARKYVYITTPYLIPDNEMLHALMMASKNGVDIKIITPKVPDKRIIQAVTRSYYRQLIENGVEIYEFTPGFIHAKNIVADDIVAVVGTVNLDFRSLYLHNECGVWIYGDGSIAEIKRDFTDTLRQSEKVESEQTFEKNPIKRCIKAVLKFFSPLL